MQSALLPPTSSSLLVPQTMQILHKSNYCYLPPKWRGNGSVVCSALVELYNREFVFGCVVYDCIYPSPLSLILTDRIGIGIGEYCIRDCCIAGCIRDCCMVGCIRDCCMAGCIAGCIRDCCTAGCMAGCMVGCMVGCIAGCIAGCMTDGVT